jgi:hypothetical protein
VKKATSTLKKRGRVQEKLVKLLIEEKKANGRYRYCEVRITEKLANELYDIGTIWWDITNEMFGCDRANFKPEWERGSK